MIAPTVAEFKAQFYRDFPYGSTPDTVMDADIQKALVEADFIVNPALFSTQESFSFAFNYAAAHYLVMDFKNSSQGLGSSFNWIESSKSVGSVSQGFSIPDLIMKNPQLAYFSKTGYGAKYLSLILPLTFGNIGIAEGATLA